LDKNLNDHRTPGLSLIGGIGGVTTHVTTIPSLPYL